LFKDQLIPKGDNSMAESKGILVYCETEQDKLTPLATEILGAGSQLAREPGQGVSALLIGDNVAGLAAEAIAYGDSKVYVIEDPLYKDYLTEAYLQGMVKVIQEAIPQIILLGQTQTGRDLAPRLAFRLGTVATLDCTALGIDPATKRLLMTKPVYGGNAQAIQVCETDPQIATLRSKAFSPLPKDPNRRGEVVKISVVLDAASIKTKSLERKTEAAAGIKLEEAKVVVTGGRGIGGAEGFKQLQELALVLKGAVGASRPCCDNKWVSDNLLIGLTGKIVSPEIYIAVAVSGSSQHLSGCSGAKVMIAINKDSEANIFKVAHYGVVGDWKKVLPAFTGEMKKLVS
jgi:electron transfer flavoprotein alpha subunit